MFLTQSDTPCLSSQEKAQNVILSQQFLSAPNLGHDVTTFQNKFWGKTVRKFLLKHGGVAIRAALCWE